MESRRVPRRDVEHCQNDPDNLGWAERLHALEEVRACARVLVQRAPGLDKLQVAPSTLLHEHRRERTHQAHREAKEPERVDTDGR